MTAEIAAQATSRALVAARLSRVTEKGRTRLERDDEKARTWAAAQGDRLVVAVSEDPGVSGATDPFRRPGLGPYLTDPALIASYDEIVASSLDRLGRNARDLARLRDWAEDNAKRITILSPLMHWPPQPDDFASPIIWDVLGRVAEMELRIITKRYADQRRDLLERGSLVGKAPWGFQIVGERGNKTLRPDPALLPYLRGMVERALRGDPYLSICRWLDAEGVRPAQSANPTESQRKAAIGNLSNKWNPKSVTKILRSPALKGRRLDAKGRVIGKHEGIMNAAEWNKLQAALDSRAPRRGPVTIATTFLTGSLLCDLCGGPMYRSDSITMHKDGTKRSHAYYRCKGTDRAPSTCRNMVPEAEVGDHVNAWFTEDGPFADTELVETVVVPGADHRAELAEIESELRDLDFDDPRFDDKQAALRAERARVKALPMDPPKVEERPTGYTVGQVWYGLSDEAKRRFLLAAGMRVHVRPVRPDDYADVALSALQTGPEWIGRNAGRSRRHWYWVAGDADKIRGELAHIVG